MLRQMHPIKCPFIFHKRIYQFRKHFGTFWKPKFAFPQAKTSCSIEIEIWSKPLKAIITPDACCYFLHYEVRYGSTLNCRFLSNFLDIEFKLKKSHERIASVDSKLFQSTSHILQPIRLILPIQADTLKL